MRTLAEVQKAALRFAPNERPTLRDALRQSLDVFETVILNLLPS